MSQIADRAFQALQNLLHDFLGARWIVDGKYLTPFVKYKYDIDTLSTSYSCFAALLSDLDCLDLPDAIKYVTRLSRIDVCQVARIFKDLDRIILSPFTDDWSFDKTFCSFKHYECEMWIKRPFVRLILHLVSDVTRQSFRRLHQAFTFLSRLSLDCVDRDRDIRDFLQRNNEDLDVDIDLARRLSPILARNLSGIKFCPWGNHGPGTTADAGRCNRTEKTLFLHPDILHKYAFAKHNWDISDYMPFSYSPYPVEANRVASLTTAPKNVLKRRVIAEETVTQQYVQQLVKNALYHHIDDCIPSIPIRNQNVQRNRARQASIYGEYSTIDLSAASDSVAWKLIKCAFRSSGIMHWIYATRTRYVKYKDDVYPLRMYATMGSATCFPIECLVFDAICRLASIDNKVPYDCTVYGDDIICPTIISSTVISYLRRLGFTVNDDKTFINWSSSCYRESCGGEYLGGVDVTPLKIPRKFSGLLSIQDHPTVFRSWVDLCNGLLSRGFLCSRAFLIRKLLHDLSIDVRVRFTQTSGPYKGRTFSKIQKLAVIPAFGTLDDSLHTYGVVENFMLQHRWNKDLQRKELWAPKIAMEPYKCKFITRTDTAATCKYASQEFLLENDSFACEIINHLQYFLWHCDKGRQDFLSSEKSIGSSNFSTVNDMLSSSVETFGDSVYKGYVCRLEYDWHREI